MNSRGIKLRTDKILRVHMLCLTVVFHTNTAVLALWAHMALMVGCLVSEYISVSHPFWS